MQLRCLAGRYAGQVLDYRMAVGLAALRSGTAARLEEPRDTAASMAESAQPLTQAPRKPLRAKGK